MRQILEKTRASSTEGVVTGTPFNVVAVDEETLKSPNRKLTARQSLDLPENADVAVVTLGGFVGIIIAFNVLAGMLA